MTEHDHSGGAFHDHGPGFLPSVATVEVTTITFGRGIGCCPASPFRPVIAYYDRDGTFLWEHDPIPADRNPVLLGFDPGHPDGDRSVEFHVPPGRRS